MTGDDLARQLGWSPSKVSRVENARISISQDDTDKFLDLFEVTESRRTRLIKLAASSPTPPSWRHREPMSQSLLAFLEIETLSTSTRQWCTSFVPGILQTEEYAKTLIENWRLVDVGLTASQVEERVALRLSRQSILSPPVSATYYIILDESVLIRRFGSKRIMHQQLAKLLDISLQSHVELFVLPLGGAHGILDESFTLFNLGDDETPGSSLPYIGSNTSEQFVFDELRAATLEREFAILRNSALSGKEAHKIIRYHQRAFDF
ncbi:transcriptional regulator with XRE-family HTH domain [Nonomuraea endophytica]|uniref:Transcriptional regulator with XRE-family HTH domain n=2 Tax=Nonomuraea endophytica TaxID=714136 RepID=A0A7W8A0F4_9ACTN|nr:transcriptional regulator with XRE-family HTH domain [Nonomuraea endophytica]